MHRLHPTATDSIGNKAFFHSPSFTFTLSFFHSLYFTLFHSFTLSFFHSLSFTFPPVFPPISRALSLFPHSSFSPSVHFVLLSISSFLSVTLPPRLSSSSRCPFTYSRALSEGEDVMGVSPNIRQTPSLLLACLRRAQCSPGSRNASLPSRGLCVVLRLSLSLFLFFFYGLCFSHLQKRQRKCPHVLVCATLVANVLMPTKCCVRYRREGISMPNIARMNMHLSYFC